MRSFQCGNKVLATWAGWSLGVNSKAHISSYISDQFLIFHPVTTISVSVGYVCDSRQRQKINLFVYEVGSMFLCVLSHTQVRELLKEEREKEEFAL